MSRGITLSPKHGVNPSIGICYFCGEEDGTIILPGRIRKRDGSDNDVEAPRHAVLSKEPCPKCKELMKQGVMLIEARQTRDEEPYRTGRLWVVKDEAIRQIFTPDMVEDVLKKRCAFIAPDAAEQIGLGCDK